MSKLNQLKTLLQAKGLWAKKSLGQNFLIDEAALDAIVGAAELDLSDHVIEVGPGTGFLTEQLIQEAKKVTAVELDEDMVGLLSEQFKLTDNLDVVHQDVLDFDVDAFVDGPYKLVANIPYYITSPLLKHFIQRKNKPSLVVVLVQKEVAQKICGITGKSMITIETQVYGEPEIVKIVPSSSFYPAPKVDSAVLRIKVRKEPLVPDDELKNFLRIVKFGFSQKRKKLSNTLGAGLQKKPSEMAKILEKLGIDPSLRAEHLEIEDWKKLARVLT